MACSDGTLFRESEEEEPEGLSWNEVEARFLVGARAGLGLMAVAEGMMGRIHLSELMDDRGMELVFVGEVPFEVATSRKRFGAEWTVMVSGELAEESMEMKVVEHGGCKVTAIATKEGKVTTVHAQSREWQGKILGLFDP